MKFFISHASQHKPTVKEIIKLLPLKISPWLDEEKLIWGSDLTISLKDAIKQKTDYVILFISESSGKSQWVQKEIEWALEEEKKANRTIVLPIIIQSGTEDGLALFPRLRDRKNIVLNDFTDHGLKVFADQLANFLFSLICAELDIVHSPKEIDVLNAINSADGLIDEYSITIRNIVFKHRKNNPISVDQLYTNITDQMASVLNRNDFDKLFEKIISTNKIPGLYYDGYELYLEEEHMNWKKQMSQEKKITIARKASGLIRNNMTIYLDAGSTTAELVKILCNRIDSKSLTSINIVTISIDHANTISEYSVKRGFDDNNYAIKLFLIGGRVRLNTEATVPIESHDQELDLILSKIVNIDYAFIGVNGATEYGFTTGDNDELLRKNKICSVANNVILLCDDSKCGIELDGKIANENANFKVIINKANNEELDKIIEKFKDKIILA